MTIYGDGKQVRDLLFVDDLIDCYAAALAAIDVTAGQIYNVGGGATNSVSVWWQLQPLLEAAIGHELPHPTFGPWRLGDQRIFYADTSKALVTSAGHRRRRPRSGCDGWSNGSTIGTRPCSPG